MRFLAILFFTASLRYAQNTRINDHNTIGWYNLFANAKLSEPISLHGEYQWRRSDLIKNWQQSLLRVAAGYQVTANVQLRAGYAWAETFPYGEYPLNGLGKDFTEHRIFEAALINGQAGPVDFSHRFMLEQRWAGRYSRAELASEDEFVYLNRARYMFRAQLSLDERKKAYIAAYDEIFIGFGRNVGENVFDQNRIGILLGYAFSDRFKLEAGYLNQTLQLGREVDGRNVFQSNNGIIVNSVFNLDFRRTASSTGS